MCGGIVVKVTTAGRASLEAVVANRNSPQKYARRCWIMLLAAKGRGMAAIMRQCRRSKIGFNS